MVLDVSSPAGCRSGARLDIFPGGATPAVFPARTPFWVGYGFASDSTATGERSLDGDLMRFELEVDGVSVDAQIELTHQGDAIVRKAVVAEFPSGLPAGWHELAGRWYEGERLLFASRADVEFVER